MSYLRNFLCAAAIIGSVVLYAGSAHKNVNKSQHPKYNVLFVVVDDLRPELGCCFQKSEAKSLLKNQVNL